MAMNAREHAQNFILPIDPRHGVRSAARRLWHLAATDPAIAGKFAAIQQRMNSARPLLNVEQYNLYERLRDKGVPPLDIPTAPEWIRPAFAAAYLRAKATIASGKNLGLFADAKRVEVHAQVHSPASRRSGGGGFCRGTRGGDHAGRAWKPRVRANLATGRRRIPGAGGGTLRPRGNGQAGSARTGSQRRRRRGDCTCCASTPSGTSCRPCSCWIIVVIIIIIVVAK